MHFKFKSLTHVFLSQLSWYKECLGEKKSINDAASKIVIKALPIQPKPTNHFGTRHLSRFSALSIY
jgi:hypothetical protein